jgi:hypothetical protein
MPEPWRDLGKDANMKIAVPLVKSAVRGISWRQFNHWEENMTEPLTLEVFSDYV